ncbi:MAG: acyltransferase [Chthoniobacterales bacterium]
MIQTKTTVVGLRNEWVDCLRGYAVILVCLSHTFYLPPIHRAFPGVSFYFKGDIGVWLFYVISGFLIGGLLLNEKAHPGGVHLGRFYGRRFSRLIPSYLALVLVMNITASGSIQRAGIHWWLFFIPWLDMTPGIGYLPFHLRTLHIEEKFYLGWGLLSKYLPRRVLFWFAVGLVVYGPIARVLVYFPNGPSTLMFDSAADCFGIGILFAFFQTQVSGQWRRLNKLTERLLFGPGVIMMLMLLVGLLRQIKPFSYFLIPFLPTVVSLLSIALLYSGWERRSVFQAAWVAKVGLASYTIYLFQQLVLCPWNDVYAWEFTWLRWMGASASVCVFVIFWFRSVEAPITVWGRRSFSSR